MSPVKTVEDKQAALKDRVEKQRALGAQIDRVLADAHTSPSGCGICHVWRRLTGRQRSMALATVEETTSSTGVATTTAAHVRLFGMKKASPHAKLAEAAASMETRVQQLESRAASERAEATRLAQAAQRTTALRMLKRAKATEKQLETLQQSLLAVEQQQDLMQAADMQKQLASALASSGKGMKAQKKLLKNAESAVDDAQDARDMADDLGSVMAEFAQNGTGNDDEDDLIAELQEMVDKGPPPSPSAMVDVSLDDPSSSSDATEYAKQQEIKYLEERIARYDASVEARQVAENMPAAPTTTLNGKSKVSQEKEALLAASVSS